MSLPCAIGTMPDATAELAPPLEPPGVRPRSHGFSVRPCRSLAVIQRNENAGQLLRPTRIAPARRRLATCGLSAAAMLSRNATTPSVVA